MNVEKAHPLKGITTDYFVLCPSIHPSIYLEFHPANSCQAGLSQLPEVQQTDTTAALGFTPRMRTKRRIMHWGRVGG